MRLFGRRRLRTHGLRGRSGSLVVGMRGFRFYRGIPLRLGSRRILDRTVASFLFSLGLLRSPSRLSLLCSPGPLHRPNFGSLLCGLRFLRSLSFLCGPGFFFRALIFGGIRCCVRSLRRWGSGGRRSVWSRAARRMRGRCGVGLRRRIRRRDVNGIFSLASAQQTERHADRASAHERPQARRSLRGKHCVAPRFSYGHMADITSTCG